MSNPYQHRGLGDEVVYVSPQGAQLTSALVAMGYTRDARGNIYYPDGQIMSGPDVMSLTRTRVVAQPTIAIQPNQPIQQYVLPNGQQAVMTAQQYQQYLAAQNVTPGSQLASGLGSGFSNFAAQFGVTPTTLVLLGIAAYFLLMKSPPSKGR